MAKEGGSYIRKNNGEPQLRERTEPHPGGHRPRDAQGQPLYRRPGETDSGQAAGVNNNKKAPAASAPRSKGDEQ